jgi:hypothetical protein
MYNIGDLSLPELEELLRRRKDLLINPAGAATAMIETGPPTAPTAPGIPAVPVSKRAAGELTPEQMQAIQSESPEERNAKLMQTLGAIAMIFSPLAGAVTAGIGKRKYKESVTKKEALVKSAEESQRFTQEQEALDYAKAMAEREQHRKERETASEEMLRMRQGEVAMEQPGLEKRRLAIEEERTGVEKERNQILRDNAVMDRAIKWIELKKDTSKGLLDEDKADYERAKDEIERRIKTAVEQNPAIGKFGRIPNLLLESWEAEAFKHTGNPRLAASLSQKRSRNLRTYIDSKLVAGIPPFPDEKKPGPSIDDELREFLKKEKISAKEYRAAVDYMKTPLDVLQNMWKQ